MSKIQRFRFCKGDEIVIGPNNHSDEYVLFTDHTLKCENASRSGFEAAEILCAQKLKEKDGEIEICHTAFYELEGYVRKLVALLKCSYGDDTPEERILELISKENFYDTALKALDGRCDGLVEKNALLVAAKEYVWAEDALPEECDFDDYSLSKAVRDLVHSATLKDEELVHIKGILKLSQEAGQSVAVQFNQKDEEHEREVAELKETHCRAVDILDERCVRLRGKLSDQLQFNVRQARVIVQRADEIAEKDARIARLEEALNRLIGFATSVRVDRRHTKDGNIFCLQTDEWCEGLIEYAEEAAKALSDSPSPKSAYKVIRDVSGKKLPEPLKEELKFPEDLKLTKNRYLAALFEDKLELEGKDKFNIIVELLDEFYPKE